MKVTTWVEFPGQEIEVEIRGVDAVAAMLGETEEWEPDQLIKKAINNVASFLRGMAPDVIAKLTPECRAIIHNFCLEQAERFK